MQTINLTVSQAIIKFIENQFVEIDGKHELFIQGIFGIFGHGNVAGIGEAIKNSKTQIKFIQGFNEQGMVHAATAFAKQKNRQQAMACTTSVGPGALNMITAAATATINRIPVLLLPGDTFACRQPDPVLQQLEVAHDATLSVNDSFKTICKYWDKITRPEQIMSSLINAFRVLVDPVDTGAVVICLPQDVQTQKYDFPIDYFKRRLLKINKPQPGILEIDEAANILQAAKRPLIVAGGGVHYSDGTSELSNFASRFKIPVCETQAGKSSLLHSHEMNVGTLGVFGSTAANILAKDADLILAMGTRFTDFTTASKTVFQNKSVKIINLNINTFDAIKLDSLSLIGDAKLSLLSLTKALSSLKFNATDEYITKVNKLKREWFDEVNRVFETSSTNKLCQTNVVGALNNFVGPNDIVVCASGSLPGDMMRLWRSKGINTFHLEYGFSCMGYEVAGGLGAKLASPKSEVYVVVGDGAFLMLHTELLTSLAQKQKINIILFNNNGFQCIRNLQTSLGEESFGNEFINEKPVDFVALAKSLGANAFFAKDISAFKNSLAKAKKSNISTLIQVDVDKNSMSKGYETFWRVDAVNENNNAREKLKEARVY
ncbi:3D-(3,5/4)-trihydroxycyclohexane-1,2-dione acylhydrolase (decyclizing) [Sulfobacillus acidophilus]|uniref:3D-(3,5/4)-trihydroxycyclohexane-1,2-dione acylhydrolase (Decyclizing) n=1 Tax=Sulfobacillus acidophilus TaxID=53633 RepID=A0ABS3AVB2_9FIRM|nr:3D-(3,5/4)-trihydroxycyclohexane-1,2-dione acylhydrolase (decyclizing) [Sulfobacillus acidophilus]